MSRNSVWIVSIVCCVGASSVFGESVTVIMDGSLNVTRSFSLGSLQVGGNATVFRVSQSFAAGTTAQEVRDFFVNTVGATVGNGTRVSRVTVLGSPGYRITDDTEFPVVAFIDTEADSITGIEPGRTLDIDGLLLTACLPDVCAGVSNPAPSDIPAVGTWGLIVMTLFLLAAGTLVIRRRSRGNVLI